MASKRVAAQLLILSPQCKGQQWTVAPGAWPVLGITLHTGPMIYLELYSLKLNEELLVKALCPWRFNISNVNLSPLSWGSADWMLHARRVRGPEGRKRPVPSWASLTISLGSVKESPLSHLQQILALSHYIFFFNPRIRTEFYSNYLLFEMEDKLIRN